MTIQFCFLRLHLSIETVSLSIKLSSVATDGKSEYGLKREKIEPTFSSFNATNAKSPKQIAMVIAPWWKFFDIFISLQEHFIYG